MLLVTGASGFVGRHLLARISTLSPAERPQGGVLPLYRSSPLFGGMSVDLSDRDAVSALFADNKIHTVIHLAAEARPAVCEAEPQAAQTGNVESTRNLLDVASAAGRPYFLYVSTDMVFRGDRDLYAEDDSPDPLNTYGRSKAEAELLVRQYVGQWSIVRSALVYGAPVAGKVSFLSWMIDAIKNNEGSFFSDEFRTPVWVGDLVDLLLYVSANRESGVIHAGGLDRLSRVDFAEAVADALGLPHENINVTSLDADPANIYRPRSLCLESSRAHQMIRFHSTSEALSNIADAGVL